LQKYIEINSQFFLAQRISGSSSEGITSQILSEAGECIVLCLKELLFTLVDWCSRPSHLCFVFAMVMLCFPSHITSSHRIFSSVCPTDLKITLDILAKTNNEHNLFVTWNLSERILFTWLFTISLSLFSCFYRTAQMIPIHESVLLILRNCVCRGSYSHTLFSGYTTVTSSVKCPPVPVFNRFIRKSRFVPKKICIYKRLKLEKEFMHLHINTCKHTGGLLFLLVEESAMTSWSESVGITWESCVKWRKIIQTF